MREGREDNRRQEKREERKEEKKEKENIYLNYLYFFDYNYFD